MTEREGPSRKLIDHLVGPAELGAPRAVLATTFDLQSDFIELDFLPALLRLPAWDDRNVRSRIQLEGELAKMDGVALLMEGSRYISRPRSLRVNLKPASRHTGGVLHAKLTLLVYEEAIRLLVGSANLTTWGYRENREVALALRADRRARDAGALVRQAIAKLPERLSPWWTDAAAKVLALAEEKLDEWGVPDDLVDERFVWGGDEEPLWKQFLAEWPKGEVVERIRIVSPFWSEEDGYGPIATLVSALKARKIASPKLELLLVTGACPESSTRARPMLPASYGTFDFCSLGVAAATQAAKPQVDAEDVERDDLRRERRLHAKVVVLEGPKTSLAYLGSANFSTPGWGFGAASAANLEAGLILRRKGRARGQLEALIPPLVGQPIPLAGAASQQLAIGVRDDDSHAWPAFLLDLSLRPTSGDPQILELVARLDVERIPAWFTIATTKETEPLRRFDRAADPPPAEVHVTVEKRSLNDLLRRQVAHVRWEATGGSLEVDYPLNVSEAAREQLPFGDPDAFPGEDQLVAFYQGRISFEDVFPIGGDDTDDVDGASGPALESTVDTSKILSYQVRNFVEALAGIRGELERCTSTEATMRLALLGPISPVALARQIANAVQNEGRSVTATAFQLVELLSCVRDAEEREVEVRVADAWTAACAAARIEIVKLLEQLRADTPGLRRGSFEQYAKTILGATTRELGR